MFAFKNKIQDSLKKNEKESISERSSRRSSRSSSKSNSFRLSKPWKGLTHEKAIEEKLKVAELEKEAFFIRKM